ncbi:MAG: 2-dehydropantoate 2-reductase [Alphaproteobacteria bacterium]|jgi:2-dehydropantoate 2-reductase
MKIAIYGAGAIGAHLGGMLSKAGVDVSLIARGPHLVAMQTNGLLCKFQDGAEFRAHPTATDDPSSLGVQDYVIVTLKAHQSPGVVDLMQPMLGPDTAVVTSMNGVPWWYFHGLGGDHDGRTLESVDPGRAQWDGLGPERAIGMVVHPATEIIEPGVMMHMEGDAYPIGEPSGEKTDRIQALSAALVEAGLRAPIRAKIRDEIWMKLWGNLCLNPVSALTGSTLAGLGRDEGVRALLFELAAEGRAVGEALGARFRVTAERRLAAAFDVGEHKTSMLQDLERGRPMEIDALVTAVTELGEIVGVPTPRLHSILSLITLRARNAGLYPA